MKFLKGIEASIKSIIQENELETSISSTKLQRLIERNINTEVHTETEHFYLNNDFLEIFNNEKLILIKILHPNKEYIEFDNYIKSAQDFLQFEIDSFIKNNDAIDSSTNNSKDIQEIDVCVYMIVNNFEELIKIQNAKKINSKKQGNFKLTFNFNARTHPITKEVKPEIRIDSRLESVKFNHNNDEVSGYIFTANLFDIAKLYKEIGTDLFSSNLRIGIKDQNNVDVSIKETILSDYKNFWYYNNGITLIVEEKNIDLGNPDSIALTYNKAKDFTVVNGAQTITSASEVFFNNGVIKKEELRNVEDQTKVLLRVITVPFKEKVEKSVDKNRDLVSNIAISLNRQKPITQEDIAYVVKFVDAINSIHNEGANNKFSFRIIRRGEGENLRKNEYELLTVARVLKAYLVDAPGPARNSGKKVLLKTINENNNVNFTNKDIFLDPEAYNAYNNASESNDKYLKIFNKHYKPVNFSIAVKLKLDSLEKLSQSKTANLNTLPNFQEIFNKKDFEAFIRELLNIDKEELSDISIFEKAISSELEDTSKIINYGKYHLISFIVNFVANHKSLNSSKDFSTWNELSNSKRLSDNTLYNHARVFSIAWKLATVKIYISTEEAEINELKIRENIVSGLDTNVFKVSKVPKKKSDSKHLVYAYDYYLKIIEQYELFDKKNKF